MRSISTPNYSARANGATPKYIVHHHMATTGFEGVLESWRTGSKQGSCHIAIADNGERVRVVTDNNRAWSLSSQFFDSQALVTEIANESIGGNWPVSAAAHEAAAIQTAEWCITYGIPCDRTHVIGHREVYTRFGYSYATACPGGLNLDWIVNRAREIIARATTAGTGTVPLPEKKDTDTDMKIIKVVGGTIALVGEYTALVYKSAGGGQGFSIGVNTKAYGEVTNLTADEVTTLVNEANARRAALVADIAKAMTVPTLDAGAIATSIITALQPQLGSAVLDGVTADAVAKAVEAALADNFAAIPSAVAGEQAERLGKPLG